MEQRLFRPFRLSWTSVASSMETPGSTAQLVPTPSTRITSSAHRHVGTVTRLIWACTSTMTWLLFLISQPPYTRAVSVAATQDHQFGSSFSPDQSQCINSLLLDRHRIPSSAFSATSDLDDPSGTRRYTAENLR
ncbi:hypothetical protein FGIG_05186 [Fasciola gigantica]|uniref:Uncharacterized protein n=1 Tax=Fasciola gigantica TaxID=46835 RepID=A0A504ZAW0_FASGI|nr:hypothetical protein FGIG_05186 [Fasciola gigantica]